jgi:hypothetical protein
MLKIHETEPHQSTTSEIEIETQLMFIYLLLTNITSHLLISTALTIPNHHTLCLANP